MIRSSPQDVMARLERDHVQDETSSRSSLLFEHDLFRKTGTHFSGSCSTAPAIQRPSSSVLFEHDLFGKPVPTFPDHALLRVGASLARLPKTRGISLKALRVRWI